MERSVPTIPLAPALIIVSTALERSKPADSGDPLVGMVAFSVKSLTLRTSETEFDILVRASPDKIERERKVGDTIVAVGVGVIPFGKLWKHVFVFR